MYLTVSILMFGSQVGQVEGLFSSPEMPFFPRLDSNDYGAIYYVEPWTLLLIRATKYCPTHPWFASVVLDIDIVLIKHNGCIYLLCAVLFICVNEKKKNAGMCT